MTKEEAIHKLKYLFFNAKALPNTDEALSMAIEALENEWTFTSERPPETDDEVIAYDGADAFVAWYGVNGWHSTDNRFDPRVPIIEWKPINLPKAEEKTNESCWKEYYESKFMKKV